MLNLPCPQNAVRIHAKMESSFIRKLIDFISAYKYWIVAGLFLLIVTVGSENSLIRRAAVRHEIRVLEQQKAHIEEEMSRDREILKELSSDSLILEHLARERYNMQRADEDVFIEQN